VTGSICRALEELKGSNDDYMLPEKAKFGSDDDVLANEEILFRAIGSQLRKMATQLMAKLTGNRGVGRSKP